MSWRRGPGELSELLVSLYGPDGTQQAEQRLGREQTEHVFQGLLPGRLYNAVVTSHSGELSNAVTVAGRTGQSGNLSVRHDCIGIKYSEKTKVHE